MLFQPAKYQVVCGEIWSWMDRMTYLKLISSSSTMNWARDLILFKALRPWLFLKAGHWFLWQSLLAGRLWEQGRCQEGLWCLEQGVRTGARSREKIQGEVEVLKLQDVKVSYELLLLNLHCHYVCCFCLKLYKVSSILVELVLHILYRSKYTYI